MTRKITQDDRAILYCRVSTEGQAVEGVSLDAQEAELRRYAERRGLVVAAVIVDAGVSGKVPLERRAGGAELLSALRRRKAPIRHVVAMKLDRLFRNLRDCLRTVDRLDRDGVALHLLDLGGQAIDTSTAIGRFFVSTMGAVAELERGMISERTRAAMKHKRAAGRRTSLDAPFGFAVAADGDTLEPVAAERAAIDRALELRAAGETVAAIAAALTAEGFEPRGKRWHPTTIGRLLRRERATCDRIV
jgi:DNA invertase Pin-like site-specific DNA recombinase